MDDVPNVQRTYALNDEAGLVLCSWPEGGRPRFPFAYCDEVWTGVEYTVAVNMIHEGMIEERPALRMPVKSRILFAEKGLQKLRSIDDTIEAYGGFSAGQLVELTHREGTPWDAVYDKTTVQIVPDKVIWERHCVEKEI